jgi:hypothetical protein
MRLTKGPHFFISAGLHDVARYWLVCILLIMPVQAEIAIRFRSLNHNLAASLFEKLDESTIVTLLFLSGALIYHRYKKQEISWHIYIILFSPIIVVGIVGMISGFLNGNSIIITLLGIFHYVKFFLLIFIYAAFFRKVDEFQKVFRLMLILAVCIGIIAIIQEIIAMYLKYIGNVSADNISIIRNIMAITGLNIEDTIAPEGWRVGIYRTPSIMSHYNMVGFYSTFILSIYLSVTKKINVINLFSLFAGVFLSVSRVAYLCFASLAGIQVLKGKKWFIALLLPVLPFLLYAFFVSNNNVFSDEMNFPRDVVKGEEITRDIMTRREYERSNAFNVWKDHPMWGVGPGMFGGDVAVKNNSPFYEEYNAMMLREITSLDQFWPQVLAEMGIIGATAFAGLLVSLLSTFFLLGRFGADEVGRGLFSGLAIFTVFIIFNTFSISLNNAPILFPYCAVSGMALGCAGIHHNHLRGD